VIDTTTFTHIDVIPLQFAPDTIVVAPDGSRVYVTHYNKSAISAIDLNSRSRTVIVLDDAPLDIAVSRDGDRLYVTNLHSLTLIDTATDVADTVPIGDLPRHLHVSGDGKRAFVTDLGHHVLWVLDPVERSILTTVDIGGPPEAVSISPSDDFLFVADRSAPSVRVIALPSPKTA
jgi:YVTN family beta-propeller protein